ncbi:hypothetical protein PVAG01_10355 [Phlyctema vagabunda]|uniref:Large ribosomal subunit protein bL21m n=1 Tax=Phlyctema vagabunda TaxID=108571 RepID=A0ABR4P5P7_9HELO
MISRTMRKALVDTRGPIANSAALPPTFLLPFRARYFNSTTQYVESTSASTDAAADTMISSGTEAHVKTADPAAEKEVSPSPTPRSAVPSAPAPASTPPALSESIRTLLPALRAQPGHFVTAHIHARPYLVTAGDVVRLPFHMPGVLPGDVLRLNRATALGSRDFTLKGTPYLDERIFECRARVMGVEAEPMRTKEKKKQRNRRIKTVRSKHKFTILRISELKVLPLEEIEG